MKILLLLLILNVAVKTESRTRKPGKSVNLALETVLEFDEKDFRADSKIINDVQSFLNKIKTALQKRAPSRRSNNEDDDFKLTDFLENVIIVLLSYKNKDLNDIFTALNDEMRKYHYKGCKFHELLESFSFRKFLSKKLNNLKNASAKDVRKQLDIYLDYLRAYKKDKKSKDSSFLNFVNSLYTAQDMTQNMTNLLEQIKTYNSPIEKSDINLTKMVQQVIRTILFDRYSNLNRNVRKDLKKRLKDYWNEYIGNSNVNVPTVNSEELNRKHDTTRNIVTTAATKPTEQMDAIPTKKDKIESGNNVEKLKTLGQLSRIDLRVYDNKPRTAIQALRSRLKLKPLKPVKLTTEAKLMQTLWVEERATTKKLLWDDDYEDETDNPEKGIKTNVADETNTKNSKNKVLDEDNKENSKVEVSDSTNSDSYENTNSESIVTETDEEKTQETSSWSKDSALRSKKHKKTQKRHGKSHSKRKTPKHSSASTSDTSEETKKKKSHHKKLHKKSDKKGHKKKSHKKKAIRGGNIEITKTNIQDDIAVAHRVMMAKKVSNKNESRLNEPVKIKMVAKKIAIDNEKSESIKNKSHNKDLSEKSCESSLDRNNDFGDKDRSIESKITPSEKRVNITENKTSSASSSESEPGNDSEKVKSQADENPRKGSNERKDKSYETSKELKNEKNMTVNNYNDSEETDGKETGDEESRKKITKKQGKNTKNYGKIIYRVSTSEEGLSIERTDMRKRNKNDTFARKLNRTAEKIVNKRINILEKELESMKHRLKAAHLTVKAKKARRFKIVQGPPTKDFQLNKKTTKLLAEKVVTNNPETITRETTPTAKSLPPSTTKVTITESTTLIEKTTETTTLTFDDKPHIRVGQINVGQITNDYNSYEDYSHKNNTDRVDVLLENIEKGTPGEQKLGTPEQITIDNGQNSNDKSVSLLNDNEKTTAQVNLALNATEDISQLFTTGDPVTDVHGNNLDALLSAPNATMIIPFGKVADSDTLKKMGVGKRSMDLLDLENEPDLAAVMQSPFGNLT